jgi:hypothetical protein
MKLLVQDKLAEPSLVDNAVLRPIIEEILSLERFGFKFGAETYYVKVCYRFQFSLSAMVDCVYLPHHCNVKHAYTSF